MNRSILFALVVLLAAGVVLGGYILTRSRDTNAGEAGTNSGKSCSTAGDGPAKPLPEPKTPEQQAEADYLALENAVDRVALIKKVAGEPWANSSTPLLKKAIVADRDENVQVEAFDRSVELAGKESSGTRIEVIRDGLDAPGARVRQQALRAARKHPSPELVPDLIEIADSKVDYRFLAVDALAFTEDPRAKAKVLEVASKDDGDKTVRVRAVALLAQTKDPNAWELLNQLSGSSDDELRKVAKEALNALNRND